MGGRRYTPAMGAVETMEDFFEKLNGGDREGAVALMDEKTEMRVHVGDSVQTLRGVERVGGWFLRGDAGLRMIPGEIRDTGNTYEADLLVVRPARRPSTSTRRSASRPAGSPRSTSRPASGARWRARACPASGRRRLRGGSAVDLVGQRHRDDDLVADRDPVRVRDGLLFASSSSSSVMSNSRAIRDSVSPALMT